MSYSAFVMYPTVPLEAISPLVFRRLGDFSVRNFLEADVSTTSYVRGPPRTIFGLEVEGFNADSKSKRCSLTDFLGTSSLPVS